MIEIQERSFHWIMGALFLGSAFLDQGMRSLVSSWNPPEASMITLVVGLIWVGRFSAWRLAKASERQDQRDPRIHRRHEGMGGSEINAHNTFHEGSMTQSDQSEQAKTGGEEDRG